MRQGQISIYYGMGKGKTAVAVGRGMRAIGEEQRVVMIQFLDYHNSKEIALLKKLEPDFRISSAVRQRMCRGLKMMKRCTRKYSTKSAMRLISQRKSWIRVNVKCFCWMEFWNVWKKDIYRNLICMRLLESAPILWISS